MGADCSRTGGGWRRTVLVARIMESLLSPLAAISVKFMGYPTIAIVA